MSDGGCNRRVTEGHGSPKGAEQEAERNANMWMEDEGIKSRFILHDHDTKYTAKFDAFFRQIIKEQAAPKKGTGR